MSISVTALTVYNSVVLWITPYTVIMIHFEILFLIHSQFVLEWNREALMSVDSQCIGVFEWDFKGNRGSENRFDEPLVWAVG